MTKKDMEMMSADRNLAFLKQNDVENFEFAKAVALSVAIFHIPLILLDLHRYIFNRDLFFKSLSFMQCTLSYFSGFILQV